MTKLEQDLDILASRIKSAIASCAILDHHVSRLRCDIATIEQACRDGLSFNFPDEQVKAQLRNRLDSMKRLNELLNMAEPGSRGLSARATLEELWRQMP